MGGDCKILWQDLENLSCNIQKPWILIGDFNAVRDYSEKSEGMIINHSEIEDFNSCINNCSLADLRSIGHPLSWNNRATRTGRKFAILDRALINDIWLQNHPLAFAEYRAPGISDHSPIVVSLREHSSLGPKPFRSMDMWLADSSLYSEVERAWSIKICSNPMYRLVQKLREVRRLLGIWNKDIFGRVDIMLPLARNHLMDMQNKLNLNTVDQAIRNEETTARAEFLNVSRREGSMMRQKSRVDWLCEGDTNSKFFHVAVKTRYHRNQIIAMERDASTITCDPTEYRVFWLIFIKNS
ncbi:uncharacterized protein LOC143888187 [Tasmannia lanceolata]|uniref:uncharacterized protein LOC143888187 n=1 Tax=Tasmannia lanceolata TaxID=3420 RepID=UPI004063FB6F